MPQGLAAAAGGQVAFRATGGLPGASVLAVGAVLLLLLSLLSKSGVMLLLWLHLGLFDMVCVALDPLPQFAFGFSCRGWPPWGLVCVLLLLHRCSALVGWLSVLECAFWGFLPLFALLHLFPQFRLFVTVTSKQQEA